MKKQMKTDTWLVGSRVVHPTHGVGTLRGIEDHCIDNFPFSALVLFFDRERLTIRIPLNRVEQVGLRPVNCLKNLKKALKCLKTPHFQGKKAVWAKRAGEYQEKLNSGCLETLAEVIAELGYGGNIESQSYSERRIFYTAVERFVEEWLHIEDISIEKAQQKIATLLKEGTI